VASPKTRMLIVRDLPGCSIRQRKLNALRRGRNEARAPAEGRSRGLRWSKARGAGRLGVAARREHASQHAARRARGKTRTLMPELAHEIPKHLRAYTRVSHSGWSRLVPCTASK
jgi:hypothetical protein